MNIGCHRNPSLHCLRSEDFPRPPIASRPRYFRSQNYFGSKSQTGGFCGLSYRRFGFADFCRRGVRVPANRGN